MRACGLTRSELSSGQKSQDILTHSGLGWSRLLRQSSKSQRIRNSTETSTGYLFFCTKRNGTKRTNDFFTVFIEKILQTIWEVKSNPDPVKIYVLFLIL